MPDGLREFLRFFEDTKEENAVNKDLMDMEEMVRHVKRNRKAGANYMKFYEELEEDPAVIARICKVAAGFAPDYDEEKICADVLKEFQMNF